MLEAAFDDALSVLSAQSTLGLALMFSYVLMLELPRYGLSMLALLLTPWREWRDDAVGFGAGPAGRPLAARVSVVVAGLNEADAIETCVRSLRAQSFKDFEIIIVSDGSTDRMPEIAQDLVRRGLADKAFNTDLRCGKSSGVNLAMRFASGDILINVDCDCSYDRYAIERIVAAFADPAVGVACGDVVPRNGRASLTSAFQVIEYLLSISLGKRIATMFDQVVCASGAFSAFRHCAIIETGGLDAGGGEDLDVTLRLRRQGWRSRFVGDAVCYTDVPATQIALIRQRMRWERDAIRVRLRKHRSVFMPLARTFKGAEAVHHVDFIVFNMLLSIAFPLYLLLLYHEIGGQLIHLLLAAQIGMLLLDTIAFLMAIAATGRWGQLMYLFFMPGYSIFYSTIMRGVRVVAYIQEWAFDGSRGDSHYVPLRVQRARMW